MNIERILDTDSGRVAFRKTDRNMLLAQNEIKGLDSSKLGNTSINLTRIENTADQAIYTCPIDLELNKIYTFGTGSSPTGTVKAIILRCNLGDYTMKISNTNMIDTMVNAGWGDFNAGIKATMFLGERNGIKGAVIMSPAYSTSYFTTTTKIDISSYLRNGWGNYTSEGKGFNKATASKMGNVVKLSGVIKGGDVSSALMVLPVELRPKNTTIVYVQYGDKNYRIDINTSGNVIPNVPLPSNSYLSLESISYSLD